MLFRFTSFLLAWGATLSLGRPSQLSFTQQQLEAETALQESVRIVQWAPQQYAAVPWRTLASLVDSGNGLPQNAINEDLTGLDENSRRYLLEERMRVAPFGPGFLDVTAHYPDDLPTGSQVDAMRERSQALLDFSVRKPSHPESVLLRLRVVDPERLQETIRALSEDFVTRHYRSTQAASVSAWVRQQVLHIVETYGGGVATNVSVSVDLSKGRSTPLQPSVIVKMEGTGVALKEEIVVLGAHLDSIASQFNPNARAPGADDDATGVACVLEVLRVLMLTNFQPERSIHLMLYSGEEGGLLGSKDVARQYVKEGKKVVAMLQLEMSGYRGRNRLTVLRDLHQPLSNFVASLAEMYVPEVPAEQRQCGYGCSDHASWDSEGYPATAIAEAAPSGPQLNPNIHKSTDTVSVLDMQFLAHFARLGVAFAIETSLEDGGDDFYHQD